MANRISRVRGPFRGRVRRKTTWLASFDSTAITSLAPNAAAVDQAFTGAAIAALGPSTIVRVRGMVFVTSDQTAASELTFGALGMAVVSEQARVAGLAAVPTPITEEASDLWFVHQFFGDSIGVATAIGLVGLGTPTFFDSKAMRKLEGDDSQAIVVLMENASATAGLEYVLKFRILVMLT